MFGHHLFVRRIGALVVLSLVSAVMLAASCSGDDEDAARPGLRDRAHPANPKPASAERAAAEDGGIQRDSQALYALIASSGQEVARGQLAQSKTASDAVREFAALMVADHGAEKDRLTALAQEKGITPEPTAASKSLESDGDVVARRLEPLDGAAFDKAFMYSEIVAHVKARAFVDGQLTPAIADEDLKGILDEVRRSIEAHLLRAQEIRRALDTDTSTSSSGGPSSSGGLGPSDGGLVPPDLGGISNEGGLVPPDLGGSNEGGLVPPDLGGVLRDSGFGFDFE